MELIASGRIDRSKATAPATASYSYRLPTETEEAAFKEMALKTSLLAEHLSESEEEEEEVQLHYAGQDERVNAGMAAYEDALKKNNVRYEQYVYDGVQHAFHNDTSAARYNETAAKLAWQRTLAFFAKHLK